MTNDKQQTAVEWLIEKIEWYNKQLLFDLKDEIKLVKEMEKEQTKNRAVESYYLYTQYLYRLPKVGGATVEMDFEQWYNETYGGN